MPRNCSIRRLVIRFRMLPWIDNISSSISRGSTRRLFVAYMLLAIVVLRIRKHSVLTGNQRHFDVPEKDVPVAVGSLVNISRELLTSVAKEGILDTARTRLLSEELSRSLATKQNWLGSECALVRPISHGLFGRGETAKIYEYLSEIRSERYVISVTHKQYRNVVKSTNSISLLTQLSSDRFHLLSSISKQWPGPMNIAVYTKREEMHQTHKKVSA